MTITVLSMRDSIPHGYRVVDTTSRALDSFHRTLSPFHLGPVHLYDGFESYNFENAWQYAKVYPRHDAGGRPSKAYFVWANAGWRDSYAHRYPMGKGAVPVYSWWDGEALDYIQARKVIYVPLYAELVVNTSGYKELQQLVAEGHDIALRDFDGYDHEALSLSLTDVLNNPRRKMGHAFVIKALLTNDPMLDQIRRRQV